MTVAPKKLIVCADGTWNDEDLSCSPTNVAKLHRALQSQHVEAVAQLVYYHSGVGTKWGDRLRGGAFGFGINRNIRECYEFLVDNYRPGDELYFFGFSRGAYTARSLAGLVRNSGIVCDRSKVAEAFAMYRSRRKSRHPKSAHARSFREQHAHRASNDERDPYTPEIKFIGVWDTVGSLGYPLPFFWFWRRVLPLVGINWWFHDTCLSKSVQFAYHAMAIHERRSDFPVTLWRQDLDQTGRPKRGDQVLEQVWFPGVHGDVGGGYGATGLSDLSLRWMVDKAKQHGLVFREHALEAGALISPDPWGRQHESFTGLFMLLDWLRLRFVGKPRVFSQAPRDRQSFAADTLARYRDLKAARWPESPSNFVEFLKRNMPALESLSSATPANSQDAGRPPMAAG